MCRKLIAVNELYLGSRQLGFEMYSLPKGEVVEFTSKQLKGIMESGKDEVYGIKLSETNEWVPDMEGFYCRNWMVKSHINSLTPKFEGESMANIFYIVIGKRTDKGNEVYEAVSSRYERTAFPEEKARTLLEMGIISAGAKLEDGNVVAALLEKAQEPENGGHTLKAEPAKTEEKKNQGKTAAVKAKKGTTPEKKAADTEK